MRQSRGRQLSAFLRMGASLMLSLSDCRALIPEDCCITDDELRFGRDQLTALAHSLVDSFHPRKPVNLTPQETDEHGFDSVLQALESSLEPKQQLQRVFFRDGITPDNAKINPFFKILATVRTETQLWRPRRDLNPCYRPERGNSWSLRYSSNPK
jgi:hypothetical protein